MDDRLPTALWLDAHFKHFALSGTSYYIIQKGAYASGTVLLKLLVPGQGCVVLQQQRDQNGVLGWLNYFSRSVPEQQADDYIKRAVGRDPDLWAIEIEGKNHENPFEGKILNN